MQKEQEQAVTLERVSLEGSTEYSIKIGQSDRTQPGLVQLGIEDETGNAITQLCLDPEEASALGRAMIVEALRATSTRLAKLEETIDLLRAREMCFKGAIGSLDIVFKRAGDENVPGNAYYDLEYYADYAEEAVREGDEDGRELAFLIENYETTFSPFQNVQLTQIRALVGGNHEFTGQIKISTKGFSLAKIKSEYEFREEQLREAAKQQ